MKKVAWVHDDALRHWWGELPAIYVFDEEKLKREQWSLKRIGFIYECLLEMPVEIWRGDAVEHVQAFQKSHNAAGVIAMSTPDPYLREEMARLGVEVMVEEPFVQLPDKLDLRRFSRYWAKAERVLLAADNLKR